MLHGKAKTMMRTKKWHLNLISWFINTNYFIDYLIRCKYCWWIINAFRSLTLTHKHKHQYIDIFIMIIVEFYTFSWCNWGWRKCCSLTPSSDKGVRPNTDHNYKNNPNNNQRKRSSRRKWQELAKAKAERVNICQIDLFDTFYVTLCSIIPLLLEEIQLKHGSDRLLTTSAGNSVFQIKYLQFYSRRERFVKL